MRTFVLVVVACVTSLGAGPVWAAGVLYEEPAGGWLYVYEGSETTYGSGGGIADSLDGSWLRGGGSDSWDGSGIGGIFDGAINDPGGLQAFTESGTNYIRIQDTGDPIAQEAVLGYPSIGPRNSKIYLARPLARPGDAMDYGITLSFRARMAITGVIDPQFTGVVGASENPTVPGGTAWPSEGNGYFNHSDGKGLIGFHQGSNGMISFSPAIASDQRNNQSLFGRSGLMTNNLNGGDIGTAVDPYNLEPGTENVLAVADWSQWHEFWITINADTSGGGTHRVRIYADGAFTPETFHVTAGSGNEGGTTGTETYLGMGLGSTSQMGAADVDFVAVQYGVIDPVPEPCTAIAVASGFMLLWSRRSRARGA